MDLQQAVILTAAAFIAGAINAVAGGGSLISFPGLLLAGYGAKVSNVTNTVAIWPGTVGGSLAYRRELAGQGSNIMMIAVPMVAGGLAGSIILLSTPESAFEAIVPFLVFGACAILAFQDRLVRLSAHRVLTPDGKPRVRLVQSGVFIISIYGGYFGAGLGILTLALFGVLLPDHIQRSNALKGLLALVVNGVSAVYFAIFGEVVWAAAALMAVSALTGGYLGVSVARRLPRDRLRMVVIGYGLIAGFVLLIRG